ncbi:ArsR/SmtB family transcription factor [Nonomuraea africana]|uniref:DNA-binding transcriptional ArsR family regulator n=1 Tax=Nonomuraea africana TaxID=46171 RepID=A0ABR9KPZ7_9ACTN|nr:winged helix-turn-helix domain-containing protein [Nonomuraea africana]MBE1564108.1 DNA-binding transcriptional ArsR family regulator [Nonomuraea africana]
MGWWQINADTLAEGRFALSPLAEATAALFALEARVAGHPGQRAWLDAHLPAYRERLAADPITALLLRAAFGAAWTADFLTPAPTGEDDPSFEEELARVRRTPPATAVSDLAVSMAGPVPAELHRTDLPERAADLLEWVWRETVLPSWPQRRRVLDADIVARTRLLTQGGWAAALDGLRPGMRWLGEGRLRINTHDYPPRDLSGSRLLFVPVTPLTPRKGWIGWSLPHRYAVVYVCSGALADVDTVPVPEALGALIGPARAKVLILLGTPKSTTQLVALTGQGLGSVGRHLKILLDAHLVRRRRAGRSVLYYRTSTGDALAEAFDGQPAGSR